MRPALPHRSLRSQHAQHLLDFGAQLGGIARTAWAIACRPEAVAESLHVIGNRIVDTGGTQRLREAVAVTGERIGHIAREHAEEFPLEAS